MNLSKCVGILILFCVHTTYAQSQNDKIKPKRNHVMLSITNGVMLNNFNVHNNDVYPSSVQAASMLSYKPTLELEYQRITKRGFTYGAGFGFGNYMQNFDVVYSSFDYVEKNTHAMDTMTNTQRFRNSSLYAGIRLFIGFNTPVKMFGTDQYSFESRLSLSKRFYFSGGSFGSYLSANYISNDTIYLYNYASSTESYWGNGGDGINGPLVMDIYLGLRKDLNKGIFNTLNLGFFATYQVHKRGIELFDRADVTVRQGHYENGNFLFYDADYYTNEEVVFGIKLGIGLRF